ncbi:hypothetical protein ABH922_005143 [Rhodococcus sp. 27YEA15]|uniref:hypothetical protein n=1 Tax=Rhodococcus sp. 27YEA15 TaxID=3156259 RepID=UPI003C7E1991
MKLTLEPTIDNGAAFAHWVDVISNIIETAITEGELTDTPTTHRHPHHTPTPPPHTDSHGTCALAPSEPHMHQQPSEKTSTSQPASTTYSPFTWLPSQRDENHSIVALGG